MRKCICVLAMLSLLAGSVVQAQASREEASAELEAVRDRIDALRVELEREGRQRTRAEQALARVEQSEQKARRELADVRARLSETGRRQRELERQADRQRAELEEQRRVLSKQLRVAYINGDEEWLRVALNQKDATGFGRRMTYYGYLSRQRSSAIEILRKTIIKLELTRLEIQEKARELAKLEDSAAKKLEDLAETRAERAKLLSKISSSIDSKDAEISKLQAQAAELTELVASLARILPEMPAFDAAPFAGRTASLSWPADGPVLKNFGQSRADGSLRWTGILLGAPAGSEVRAVYHGRVIFSDWLDGMGLLTIIEHGDGYMSLYGHNQDLLKEVGEWVSPGEPIGHVGDSGGQATAGLYFEIRKDGDPVNPRSWIK
ncbi:MAG: peptidoglycan DD-metalloendopeptidase family protein [Gammaproteobacteria bacterium]|nr:peptidoglycan DD-metalloendopeptidase family protein [Gammaproteobacteria bacterium]MDP7094401.1 peptidoglycan DD-metalloendopeptidase family protein [Gammaproteobacteria bacterium]